MSDARATSFYAYVATDGTVSAAGQRADGTVPAGATAVSEDHYNTILASPGQCRMVNGTLILTPAPVHTPPGLDAFKAAALLQVDAAAEAARLQFITPGSGQALEYEATAAEAARALALPAGSALQDADYPWLAAERDAIKVASGQALTLLAVAQMAQATMAGWSQAGSAIKRIRRTAKLQIGAASTIEQVHAVLDGLVWPSTA